MVIVLDTNVFVGACLGTGASNALIGACIAGQHRALMSNALFAEYEDVLSRSAVFAKSKLSASERDELLDVFLASCRWTRIYYGWRPNLPDEADNHLIELAVAGGGSHIVTYNLKDLQSRELRFPGLAAVTPAQFMKLERST